MKKIISSILFGACILLSNGCSNVVSATHKGPLVENEGKRTWGRYIDDGVIESKAKINISNTNEELADARIDPISYNGIVLLVGQVSSPALKQRATEVVKHIRHVKTVENQLTIEEPIPFSQRFQDSVLSSRVKLAVSFDSPVSSNRVKVVTENGAVYLMGLLTRQEAEAVVNAVSTVSGITKIVKVFEYLD